MVSEHQCCGPLGTVVLRPQTQAHCMVVTTGLAFLLPVHTSSCLLTAFSASLSIENVIRENKWGGVDIRRGGIPVLRSNLICLGYSDGVVVGDEGKGLIEGNTIYGEWALPRRGVGSPVRVTNFLGPQGAPRKVTVTQAFTLVIHPTPGFNRAENSKQAGSQVVAGSDPMPLNPSL